MGVLSIVSVLTLLFCSIAASALAYTPPAQAPEWKEGDRWGFGAETDAGIDFLDELTNLTNLLEGVQKVKSVNELSANGGWEFWMLFQVTSVTDDTYAMKMNMAMSMDMQAAISITAELDEPGTYNLFEVPDTVQTTVSARADIEAVLLAELEVRYDRSTMAIRSISIEVEMRVAATFKAENLPRGEQDWTNMTKKVWYDDYDVQGELKLSLDMNIVFNPGLDVWDFPIYLDEVWWSNCTATIKGNITGYLDIEGLPEDVQEAIFTEDLIEKTGFSDFPIVFEDIDVDDAPIDHGVIDAVTEDIRLKMECTDHFVVADQYHGDVYVYVIRLELGDLPLYLYYSEEIGFMSSISMDAEGMEPGIGQFVDKGITTMSAADPDTVELRIDKISERFEEIDEDNGAFSLFTEPPYLGLMLIMVVLVVVVAAVLVVRKK